MLTVGREGKPYSHGGVVDEETGRTCKTHKLKQSQSHGTDAHWEIQVKFCCFAIAEVTN